jgi:hypothetical protein
MTNSKLMEQKGVNQAVIIKLLPDDYHGMPEIVTKFPPDPFPTFPTREEVFQAWSNAGYNAYNMGGGQQSEREVFEEFGDMGLYYAIYIMIIDNPAVLEANYLENRIQDATMSGEIEMGIPEFVEMCEKIPGINKVIPLPGKK